MLILIDRSVVDNETNPDNWSLETIKSLEMLAFANQEQKHLVLAKKPVLEKIQFCKQLSNNARYRYKQLYNQATYLSSYRETVTMYMQVVAPNDLEPREIQDGGKVILRVPVKFFNDTEKIQKTILLGENLTDTKFYQTIAKVFCVWKEKESKKKLFCSLEHRGGG